MSVLLKGKTLIHAFSSSPIQLYRRLPEMATFHVRLDLQLVSRRLKSCLRHNDTFLILIWQCEHSLRTFDFQSPSFIL